MHISLIAAVTHNLVIGHNNDLVWRNKEDMAHFKELTMGHIVIMGRNTWESIPERFRPLEGRENIVVSRTLSENAGSSNPKIHLTPSFKAALIRADEIHKSRIDANQALVGTQATVFVIGGGQIYREALPYADDLFITDVEMTFPVDENTVFFPNIHSGDENFVPDWSQYKEGMVDANGVSFAFTRYYRR